jgi:hypothetical protein
MSEVDVLGGGSMFDYFMGTNSAVPAADYNDLANNWLSPSNSPAVNEAELAATARVYPVQPSYIDGLVQPLVDVGGGVWGGLKETAAGVAKALPDVLLGTLAKKLGLVATPAKAEDGKTTYYLTQPAAGVPAASTPTVVSAARQPTVINSGGSSGIATSTIVIGVAIAALAYLVVKSR